MNQDVALADAVRSCALCKLHTERTGNAEPIRLGKRYEQGGLALWTDLPLTARDASFMSTVLQRAGINSETVAVLSRVRCKPLRNRLQDYPDAVIACDEWSKKELEHYQPSVVVLAGNTAMRAVFGVQANITGVRGTVRATGDTFEYGGRRWVPTWHPAAALRNPELVSTLVDDLRLAKDLL